jgi:hypothetical protein
MPVRHPALVPRYSRDLEIAKRIWPVLSDLQTEQLELLLRRHKLSVASGDLLFLDGRWYVTHTGLLAVAHRNRCAGMHVEALPRFCDASTRRWAFRATVFKSSTCKGFVGYADADPSNISSLMHGTEMRVAETRAVSRALRKAYGIGICSVEELGSLTEPAQSQRQARKLPPPQPADGNYGGPNRRGWRMIGLCLGRQELVEAALIRRPGAESLDWLDEFHY